MDSNAFATNAFSTDAFEFFGATGVGPSVPTSGRMRLDLTLTL